MLTKRDVDFIRALGKARERRSAGQFVAEGFRLVHDMLGTTSCTLLVVDASSLDALRPRLEGLARGHVPQRIEVVPGGFDFTRISHQQTPQPVLAVFALPHQGKALDWAEVGGLTLLLDRVQDPGNVGTIIRTADWFGLRRIFYTEGTADPFSPKVVQATMGALARVEPTVIESGQLAGYGGEVLGTFLDGESLYTSSVVARASGATMLVMGNEGVGISPEVARWVTRRITIPSLASGGAQGESLNVAIAAAICLSELARSRYPTNFVSVHGQT